MIRAHREKVDKEHYKLSQKEEETWGGLVRYLEVVEMKVKQRKKKKMIEGWESCKPVSRRQYYGHYGILQMTSVLDGFDEVLCILCGEENTIIFISAMNKLHKCSR